MCKNARKAENLTLLDIATAADVSQSTVSNFEIGNRWRRETDRIVDAYASECGVPARELWIRAINLDE